MRDCESTRTPPRRYSKVGHLIGALTTIVVVATSIIAVGYFPVAAAAPTQPSKTPSSPDSPHKLPPYENDKWAGYGVGRLSKGPKAAASRPHVPPYVRGSWRVPPVKCSGKHTAPLYRSSSAMWLGLTGSEINNPPLEQIGTISECDSRGRAAYGAAYQMVATPGWVGNARRLDRRKYQISANDLVVASVKYLKSGRYELDLRNETRGWFFSESLSGSARSDAHDVAVWIVEAPTRDQIVGELANFGTAQFVGCFTNLGPIDDPQHTGVIEFRLTKASWRNRHEALPEPYEDSSAYGTSVIGSNFSVRWKR
jgi:Peptidase A4 family